MDVVNTMHCLCSHCDENKENWIPFKSSMKNYISCSLQSQGNMLFPCDLSQTKTSPLSNIYSKQIWDAAPGETIPPQLPRKSTKHKKTDNKQALSTLRRQLKTPMQANADVQDHASPSVSSVCLTHSFIGEKVCLRVNNSWQHNYQKR